MWVFLMCFYYFTTGMVFSRIVEEQSVPLAWSQAVTGGLAELPCDTRPPTPGDKVHLVLWHKDGSGMPIYSYDARSKMSEQAQHWSDEQTLGGRAYFRTTREPSSLTVENVRDSDGGVYRCRVDFKKSPTRNYRVNLTIIVPPQKVSILDERGSDVNALIIGPYNEGSSLTLTCEASGGRPRPHVTWWRETSLLDDSFESSGEGTVRNTLTLGAMERSDLHARLVCQANNNNMSIPVQKAVTLDMNFRPLEVRLLGDRQALSADKEYHMICQALGARPPAVMTWWKGSTRLKNTKESTTGDGNVTSSTLTFTPTLEDSGKFLSCRAENPIIPSSAIEDGWKMDIHYVPIVSLDLGSTLNASNIREGVDVYFECSIKSNPWIYKVSWRHNGMLLNHNSTGGIIISNQSLVLQAVSRSSAELYTCVASNKEGDGESNPVYLDVKYTPICRTNQQRVYGVARQEGAKVLCEVEANPLDVTFKWKFNNTAETIDIQQAHFSSERIRRKARSPA